MQTLVDRDIDRLVFEPPEPGCVMYLPGLPGGGSKIYDRSPYGNIGAIAGAVWKRLPGGLWYLSFDGTDDVVDCGTAASLNVGTGDFAVEQWVKPTAGSGAQGVVYKRDGTGFFLRADPDASIYIYFYLAEGGSYRDARYTASNPWDGGWHHLVGQRKSDETYIIFDGTDITNSRAGSGTNLNLDVAAPLKIGYDGSGYFDGGIVLVRLYRRALSDFEIRNHFNREKHLFGVW